MKARRREDVETNLSPSDDSSFHDHLRLLSEVLRLPEYEIGELAFRNLTDDVTHSVGDGTGE